MTKDIPDKYCYSTIPHELTAEEVVAGAKAVDFDNDGFSNHDDNCPAIPNADQSDKDGEGEGDVCDSKEIVVIHVKLGIDYPPTIYLNDTGHLPITVFSTSYLSDVRKIDPQTIKLSSIHQSIIGPAKEVKVELYFEDKHVVCLLNVQELVEAEILTPSTEGLALTANLFDGKAIIGAEPIKVVT